MTDKDGKCVCFVCGHRVDGLFKPQGHASGCPVGSASKGKVA